MTAPEHYRSAEAWVYKAENADARGAGETSVSCAGIAQVHATLALALAIGDMLADFSEHLADHHQDGLS
jgi:hypothetical protein